MSLSVGTAIGYLELDTSKFQSGFEIAKKQLQGFTDTTASAQDRFTSLGNGLKTIGSNISKYVTVPLVGIGTASIATAADFEKSMDNVAALSGATGKDLEALTNIAKEMGSTTQFSASESADALGYMALAGWDTKESIAALPGVLDLAASSGMGLADASDMVTDYLSAFGEEADQAGRMADVLAKAQASSNTTAQQLGEAFKNCAVNANSFGLDIEQTAAVLGKLADQGLKGSEAGTALNAVFRDMSSKMEDGAIAIGEANVKITDAQGNFRSLADIVTDVNKATDGLSESEKMVALQSTFTAESIKGMGILLNTGGDSINDFTNALYGAEGAASEMAIAMNDNLNGQLTQLKSALEGAAISIGEALMPMMKGLVELINNLVDWFNNLNPEMQTTIVVIAGIVAAIGPVLIIIGQMSLGIGALIGFLGKVKLAIIAFGTIMKTNFITVLISANMFITGTVIPALTGFATFITGTVIPAIVGFATTIASTVISAITSFATMMAGMVMSAISAVASFLTGVLIPTLTATAFSIGAVTIPVWAVIAAFAALVAAGVWVYQNWDTIKAKCTEIWQNHIQPTIQTVTSTISSFVTATWEGTKGFLSTCWGLISSLASTVWNGIKSVITTVVNAIKTTISSVFNAIKTIITTVVNGWKTVITTAWNSIKTVISTAVNNVKTTISNVWSTLTNILTKPFQTAQSIISGILGGITSAINKVTSGIKSVTSLFRTVEPPQMEVPNNSEYMEVDYSKVRFNYANAKETTLSDVMARNNSMTDTIKTFSNNIKSDNNINSSFLNDFKETVKGLSNTAKEIIVPVVLDGKEIARVIAPYTDNVNGNRINLSERGLVL